jgi:hypothetical protein
LDGKSLPLERRLTLEELHAVRGKLVIAAQSLRSLGYRQAIETRDDQEQLEIGREFARELMELCDGPVARSYAS